MKNYLDLLWKVKEYGIEKSDRTGTGTRSLFGEQLKFDLQNGFPLVTTRKMNFNAIVSELLWFLSGSTDERYLCELTHNTRDNSKSTIWTANANAEYWKDKARFDGDCGRIYSEQWRTWKKPDGSFLDQITQVIESIKNDPDSRRHIVIAYNPGEIEEMCLPPCHILFQFYVANEKLSCQFYQRSQDLVLGGPFNYASYALLTHMIAQVTNLKVGSLINSIGDVHIYNDHLCGVKEQLSREPFLLPNIKLNPDIKDIFSFKKNDIELINYNCHDPIKFKMSV